MKTPDPIVLEIKQLVKEGISGIQEARASFDLPWHLVKYYFKARKVEIDYTNELVKVEIPVADNRYTQVNISCQPLEQFLCSCVKTDEESLQHYRGLLQKVSEEVA